MESLEELADQRDQLKEEERKILAELGGTQAKATKLRDELHTLRKNRDDLNETVKALKKTRDELRDSSRESLSKLREIVNLTKGTDEGSRAERKMADLEWEIQTSTLDKEEETRLLNRIRILEKKVGVHRKSRKLSEQIGKYRIEADEIHAKIQDLAAQSQAYHLEVVEAGEKFQDLRDKLDGQRKMLDEIRLKASEVGRKYAVLRTSTMQAERVSQREKEKAFKESLKETAKKKLSEHGKVSLEELGALMGDENEE